ncbi:serine/threonine-protein kinase [Actinomycetospora sp. TBRC 11914]|uniref:serine/threonine-protein kinase n=1 Tax=Actinomycetospora sp. TBRC 11914 TaxID=2729387 RepID=UPI001B7D6353|nr:serine/threonine-protein kinase [Actinomycetospora sp. TBRC 11914]
MAQDDQLIAGRYRLGVQVGSGAMGVVWRAEDEVLRRTVALKQVRLPGGIDDESREKARRRVMREGRLSARLHHPHAIAVFDVVDHDEQPWLVMEYLPSESLAEVVATRGVLTPHAVAGVGHQVAAALTAAHTAGIVHRDVKPGNVLLGDDGVVKVTDFGVSRAIDEATITSSGMMAGTPAYLAPEVARGAEADFRSDVYSLGSTIYAALEGRPPFGRDENALAQLHRVATGDYVPPRHAGPLASLLERVLAADPARRPEMHQVRDELGRLAAVEAETDEWTGDHREPTGPTAPVTPVVPVAVRAPSEPTLVSTTAPVAPEAGVPDAEAAPGPGAGRRRRHLVGAGVAVLLVGAVVVAALVLATRSGSQAGVASSPAPTSTGQPGGSGSASDGDQATASGGGAAASGGGAAAAPVQGSPDQVAQQQAVIDYYRLIPDDLSQGWQHLTPSYQRGTAGGFAGYSGFWSAIRRVDVRGVSPGAGDTVDATVTYVHPNGSTSEERTLFRMVQQDGTWKIDGSQVLSSR